MAHHQLHGGREGSQHIGQRHQGIDQHDQPGGEGKDIGKGHEQNEEAGAEHHGRYHQDHGAAGFPECGGAAPALAHLEMATGEQQGAAEQGGEQAGADGDKQRMTRGLPQGGGGERREQGWIEPGNQYGQQRWQEDASTKQQHQAVDPQCAWLQAVRAQASTYPTDSAGRTGLQLVLQQQERGGQQQLHQGQSPGCGEIKVEAQCLIDGDFQGRGFGAAPQSQHCGKAGKAEHEDETGQSRQGGAHERPLQQAEDV